MVSMGHTDWLFNGKKNIMPTSMKLGLELPFNISELMIALILFHC